MQDLSNLKNEDMKNKSTNKAIKKMIPKNWRSWLRKQFRSNNDRRFWWLTGVPSHRLPSRRGLVQFEIQEACYVESYWVDQISYKDGINEFGPAAIVVIHGSEILKFDCYGENNAHFHLATPYPNGIRNGFHCRIWWSEKSVEEQIAKTIFELRNNLSNYLSVHPRRKVRKTRIDEKSLFSVCQNLQTKILSDVKEYGSKSK